MASYNKLVVIYELMIMTGSVYSLKQNMFWRQQIRKVVLLPLIIIIQPIIIHIFNLNSNYDFLFEDKIFANNLQLWPVSYVVFKAVRVTSHFSYAYELSFFLSFFLIFFYRKCVGEPLALRKKNARRPNDSTILCSCILVWRKNYF